MTARGAIRLAIVTPTKIGAAESMDGCFDSAVNDNGPDVTRRPDRRISSNAPKPFSGLQLMRLPSTAVVSLTGEPDGDACATLCTTAGQYFAAVLRGHASAESVRVDATAAAWLVGTLHRCSRRVV
jgi:hypothetical protein